MSSGRLSRIVRAPREAVWRACSEPAELVRWRFPLDMTAHLLGVEGPTYRMTLGYEDGRVDAFESTFVARLPREQIVEHVRLTPPTGPAK